MSTGPWWGLRPLDYFEINQFPGETMADFRELVRPCYQHGLKLLF